VFKKQIQKIFAVSILSLILLGFLPFSAPKLASADDPIRGDAPICEVKINNSGWFGSNNADLNLSHDEVASNQPFSAYVKIALSVDETAKCKANGSKDYEIAIYAYNSGFTKDTLDISACKVSQSTNQLVKFPLTFDEAGKKFEARINNITLKSLFSGNAYNGSGNYYCVYAYLYKKGATESNHSGYATYKRFLHDDGTTTHPSTTNLPSVTTPLDFGKNSTVDNTKAISAATLQIKFTGGLKDKYRLVKTDGDLKFGGGELDSIMLDWGPTSPKLSRDQYLSLTTRADYTIQYNTDPRYQYTRLYFASGASKFDANAACQSSMISEGCGALFSGEEWGGQNKGKGTPSSNDPSELPNKNFNPSISTLGWNKSKYNGSDVKPAADGLLGTEKFYAVPVIWGKSENLLDQYTLRGFLPNYSAYLMGKGVPQITIEIYDKIEDIKKKCEDENPDNKTICTDEYSRYGIGKTVETTTSSSETDSNNSPSNTLYAFIVRVISNIVVWLQSIIYRIFAYIVVPIIKALLNVRPYKDTFVNIIYPGWLILRNLANIFFIVSLLVVGLRILFQQSDSSTARSFILRLVIMALLVNFSLVIAQGIVGIADTVQAQFLPKDSRVIEALGAKLMVEPLKSFRAEVLNKDEGGAFTSANAELSLADTIKPIVLLMLSVAAFWAFVALAAFLLVRLVALWILYMTSPIAYVAFVMNETKSYANKWWKQFIKYAMITPIMVFFLNIAALMASAFAGSDNTLFTLGEKDSLPDDIVIGSLTIITHFIILGVMFVGMKAAADSGTFGAKAITNFAEKGFKNTFKKPAQWGNSLKDSLTNSAANGLEKRGWGKSAKLLTATMKPVDFAKAVKKAQIDDRGALRDKQLKERIGNTKFAKSELGDTSKMGSSLKRAKEKMKDFEGDDAAYLSQKMAEGAKKKDKDLMSAAMLKMGQEGQFKPMLDKAKEITGNKYSEDAAGLNAMTEDLVSRGMLTNENRRDLLNEFDKTAGKKKDKAHFGGNIIYDDKEKKYKIRERTGAPNNDGKDEFKDNTYDNKDSWLRGQIKSRTGSDAKGSLKTDLTTASVSSAVGKDGKITDAQIGVFAEQTEDNLKKKKIWDAAEEAQPEKIKKMQNAIREHGRGHIENKMKDYMRASRLDKLREDNKDATLSPEDIRKINEEAKRKTDAVVARIQKLPLPGDAEADRRGGDRADYRGATPTYEIVDEDDGGEDDEDEEEPAARAGRGNRNEPRGEARNSGGNNVTRINQTNISQTVPGPQGRTNSYAEGVARGQTNIGNVFGQRNVDAGQSSNQSMRRGSAVIGPSNDEGNNSNQEVKQSNPIGFMNGRVVRQRSAPSPVTSAGEAAISNAAPQQRGNPQQENNSGTVFGNKPIETEAPKPQSAPTQSTNRTNRSQSSETLNFGNRKDQNGRTRNLGFAQGSVKTADPKNYPEYKPQIGIKPTKEDEDPNKPKSPNTPPPSPDTTE
jgi:hypothetical protein